MQASTLIAFLLSSALVAALTPVRAFAQIAATTQITLQIGTQPIRIPTPEGFVETSRRSNDLWSTAQAFNAGDARIIGHFVTDKDLAEYEKGKTVVFKNFLLVQTPRRAEALIATQAQFDKLRAGTAALQADLAQRLEPLLAAELDQVSKAVSSKQAANIKVHLGEIVPVSVDRNDARLLIYTVLSQTGVADGKSNSSQTSITSTAYCFIAGKVVMLAAYRQFRTPQDLQAARTQITTWANAVLASN